MCYAVPAIILSIDGEDASVDYGGVQKSIKISLLDEAGVGDYVLVHAGFAIEKVSEERARASNSLIQALASLNKRG